jgi:chemotaxis protein methyltransferase CheR
MTTDAAADRRRESEELKLLAEQVYSLTGYDFRDFKQEVLRPRLQELTRAEGLDCLEALRERLLRDPAALGRAVESLARRPSSLFRDPEFFASLREHVVPLLRTYPSIRAWVAGCGTGEEAYSLAILLAEEGLLPRSRVYATDLSPSCIRAARSGAYPLGDLRGAAEAHQDCGGRTLLSDHYRVEGPLAVFRPALKERIVFSEHSLATDASFNEFHLIVSRDVIVQFNRGLQDRVFRLIDESLCSLGVLGLGKQHTLAAHPLGLKLERIIGAETLFRKVR